MGNAQNLIPNEARTPEERRENARKAGKASGAARREKKLMSEIYAEYLAKEHDITVNGAKKKISGSAMLSQVMTKVLARGDSASVSLLKEIRESTEGQKMKLDIENAPSIKVEFVNPNDSQPKNPDSIRPSSDGEQTV